jgi:hypothetical protein
MRPIECSEGVGKVTVCLWHPWSSQWASGAPPSLAHNTFGHSTGRGHTSNYRITPKALPWHIKAMVRKLAGGDGGIPSQNHPARASLL